MLHPIPQNPVQEVTSEIVNTANGCAWPHHGRIVSVSLDARSIDLFW